MLTRQQHLSFYSLALLCCLLFGVLTLRLYQLQIIEGAALADIAQNNSQRLLYIDAPRGQMFSAEGQPLATNQLVFQVAVNYISGRNNDALAKQLAELLADPAYSAEAIATALNNHYRRYQPLIIASYAYQQGLSTINRLAEQLAALSGVQIIQSTQRYYPFGHLAGHVLGYIGAISVSELEELAELNYQPTNWLGKSGLEYSLERWQADNLELGLRGQVGIEQIEVTANHRKVRTLFQQAAEAGHNMHLTLRLDLQKALEQALAETIARIAETYPQSTSGAAVMLCVPTGAVLAIASYPPLNPNDFVGGLTAEQAAYYWQGINSPSLNRAISAYYPPGSVFKAVTALAALNAGVSPSVTVYCSPATWNRNLGQARCMGIHGAVDLQRAMAVSCNIYFQQIGARIGIEALVEVGQMLGIGQLSGINLPHEVAGNLPTPAWKAENFSGWEADWHLYDTFFTSIGQGYTTVTPLQLAVLTATIANNGLQMQPFLLQKVTSSCGELLYQHSPQMVSQIQLPVEYFYQLQQALGQVMQPGGTGYRIFADLPVAAGGKSGTAQTGLPGGDHGLFIAFAPLDAPEVAVAAVIEFGQGGSRSAAYVCYAALAAYFGD